MTRRMSTDKVLRVGNLNPLVLNAEYAVRGKVAIRAEELRKALQSGESNLPFKQIVYCNIGNPQQVKQKPISFFRQVLALVEYPELMSPEKKSTTEKLFPKDVIERASSILRECGGNVGGYSHSQGIPFIRQHVAEFIAERDGIPSDPSNIYLTAGASQGVQQLIQCIVQHENVGIMIPIPQYPLYSATLALNNGKFVPYYLDEKSGWDLSVQELKRSLEDAKSKGIETRALCVINPGNPTGNCLALESMNQIVEFCAKERLVLMADEVYQTNVYNPNRPFISFKKVVASGPYKDKVELISFHSVSKGFVGECGRRGGYFECFNIAEEVKAQIYKLASISLCPAISGQILVDMMVKPPKEGDESYALYKKETYSIFDSLKRRASKLSRAFNQMEGVSCQPIEGAMYAFPTITVPKRAQKAAKEQGMSPDLFYVLRLLEETGVCVVPGSGFGQQDGTFHFRSTFLPPEEQFDDFLARIAKFHQEFIREYRD